MSELTQDHKDWLDIKGVQERITEARTKKRIELLDRVMASRGGGNPFLDMAMEELRDALVDQIYLEKELYVPCGACMGTGVMSLSSSGEACSSCKGSGRGPLRT